MTDAPDRKIGGLSPRTATPDLTRLLHRNREAPVTTDVNGATPLIAKDTEISPRKPKRTGKQTTARTKKLEETSESGVVAPMTIYVDTNIRARARAAFKATSHLEDDKTWSAFVQKAIMAETKKRELEHNNNEPYESDGGKLSAGRPLS